MHFKETYKMTNTFSVPQNYPEDVLAASLSFFQYQNLGIYNFVHNSVAVISQ